MLGGKGTLRKTDETGEMGRLSGDLVVHQEHLQLDLSLGMTGLGEFNVGVDAGREAIFRDGDEAVSEAECLGGDGAALQGVVERNVCVGGVLDGVATSGIEREFGRVHACVGGADVVAL